MRASLSSLKTRLALRVRDAERTTAYFRDAVLMDIEMPGMDGIEATRRIRAGEAGQAAALVPIVALTAHVLPEYREKTLQAGMNAYLAKPLSFEELTRTLAGLLGRCPRPGRIPPFPPQARLFFAYPTATDFFRLPLGCGLIFRPPSGVD